MGTLISLWNWFSLIMTFLWPIIWLTDFFLRNRDPYRRRMKRGKFYRWELRTFGYIWSCAWEVPIIFCLLGMMLATGESGFAYIYWLYVAIVCAIDWITGSDDPPYRRWLASLSDATKKLKISPPPRPVIERS